MKKLAITVALTTSLTAALFTNATAQTIGVTVYKYDDNFMALVRKNLEKLAKDNPSVKLLMNDSQNDQSKQNDQVDVMVAKGVKALAINLVDPAGAGVVISKAKAHDLPVVFYNKEPSAKDMASYDKAYYVGTDPRESGIIQADLIMKYLKSHPDWDLNKDGMIQFVLLKGEPGHPDAEARTKYVIDTLNTKHNMKTEQLHLDTGMWDTAMAKDKMDAWISGPNANKIEVVISNNDAMAMGAIEALKSQGKSLPVFGVDALPEALVLIEKGVLAGTVLNDAVNQSKATFELVKNLANGKPATEGTEWKLDGKVVRVPYVGVDKSNLVDFK